MTPPARSGGEDAGTRVVRPAIKRQLGFLLRILVPLLLIVIIASGAFSGRGSKDWLKALIAVPFVVLIIVSAIRRVPSLTLDGAGLHYRGYFRNRFWRWSDMGPFSADWFGRDLMACAHSSKLHAQVRAAGLTDKARPSDADIALPLNMLGQGLGLVTDLNAWRERNSHEETASVSEAQQIDADRVRRLLRWRRRRFWGSILAGFVLFLFALAGADWLAS